MVYCWKFLSLKFLTRFLQDRHKNHAIFMQEHCNWLVIDTLFIPSVSTISSLQIQDVCFSNDSRWVAVSTLNGTTHVFPITPYGGDVTVRTHTSSRVVNQLSRFHTSAGIETFPSSSSSSHSQRSTASSAKGPSSQAQPQSPPREARDVSSSPSVMGYGGTAPHSWSNPRSLPLPSPVTVSALQQIKQPYLTTSGTVFPTEC